MAGLSLAACRQADGPIPIPDQNVQDELKDVGRDLQNISTGDPEGPTDLAHDLGKYTERPPAVLAVSELSRRAAGVLPGKSLPDQAAQQLAHDMWVSIAARETSERQVETLQNSVQSLLISIGVVEEGAQRVAAQVGEVQHAVSERPRRWYEVF